MARIVMASLNNFDNQMGKTLFSIFETGMTRMIMQTIATTINVGKADRPGGTTPGVGRDVASANFVMKVEADYVGHDPYSGRSRYYIGVVSDVTFSPATVALTNELWREDRRSVIGKRLHVCGVPI